MLRNYFADLELEADASRDEIRRAFKKLARRFHPDVNPGDPLAAESFRRIKEAFEYLNDDSQAKDLREKLRDRVKRAHQEFGRWDTFFGTRPRDRAEFEEDWFEEPSSAHSVELDHRVEVLDIHLNVERLEDLENVEIQYLSPCNDCRGQGGSSGAVTVTCKQCAGLGFQSIERGAFRWKKTCKGCSGKGYQVAEPCSSCGGVGKRVKNQRIRVRPPSGFTGEQSIRVQGFGHKSYDGTKRGDLWLRIRK